MANFGNIPASTTTTGSTQDTESLLLARAASYVGSDFAYAFHDQINLHDGWASIGQFGVTAATLTAGRSGGGKIDLDMAGAGGVVEYHTAPVSGQSFGTGLVADANYDRWYCEWRGSISAVSAVGEIMCCMIARQGAVAATDAGSNSYIYLGMHGPTSTTLYTLVSWDGSTKRTVPTSVAIDLGINREHAIAMGYDGNWGVDVIVDGVVQQTVNIGALQSLPTQGTSVYLQRTTTATHCTVRLDYQFLAAARL